MEVPTVAQWKQIRLVSMRMWVWSLALLSGLRTCIAMSCVAGHRLGWDPLLLWLWHRPADVAPIWPPTWELPCALGADLKSKKKKKKKRQKIWIDFFQRRHADGQQVHEKMLNIINHQRNANKEHNEISPHTYQNGYHQKDHKWQMLARMWRKEKPFTLLVGCKLFQELWKTIQKVLQTLKVDLLYDLAIPLLGIHSKKTTIWKIHAPQSIPDSIIYNNAAQQHYL